MIIYKYKTNKIELGDILLTVANFADWWSIPIALLERSLYVHATIYLGDNKEWSVQYNGTEIRKVGTDRLQHAFRPYDEKAAMLAIKIAQENPVKNYAWDNLIWQGVQDLSNNKKRTVLHLIQNAQICSEAVTDIYVKANFDIVPEYENGTTHPKDIPNGLVYRL